MTHFAIPGDGFSPAEAELVTIFDSRAATIDTCVPLGLLFCADDQRMTVILMATAIGHDVVGWWTH